MSGGMSGGAQTGGNMYNPMQSAFSPKGGATIGNPLSGGAMAGGNMGNPGGRYGAQTPPPSALLTGDYGQTGGNMLGQMGASSSPMEMFRGLDQPAAYGMDMSRGMRSPMGGMVQSGGLDQAQTGGNMYGAMNKTGGGVGQPMGGGGWGGYGTGGGSRGQVPFYQWDQGMARQPPPTWGGQPGPGNPPVTAVPPGGPAPSPVQKAAGGVDHMANLKALMGEDPRLANEYRLRNGDTINWWQQNQGNVAQGLFGGNEGQMQEWLRGTNPVSSNAAPLTQQEMMRLNQMAGIKGPSWLR